MKFKIIKFKNINSTNTKAIELIKKGKTLPTILTAEKQTKGRGRYGRKWKSQKGNLFMSIYHQLYSNISVKKITDKNCLKIKKALSSFLTHKIKIKAPNDLLINGKKFCGILQEIIIYKNIKYLIVGIGINLFKSCLGP